MTTNKWIETHKFKNRKGLVVFRRENSKVFHSRIFIDGKYKTKSTGKTILNDAKIVAFDWLEDLQYKKRHGVIIHDIALKIAIPKYLNYIHAEIERTNGNRGKYRDQKSQLGFVQRFFGDNAGLREINRKSIVEFKNWRITNNPSITDNSLHKDFVAIRGLMNFSIELNWIESTPPFPSLKKEQNPRQWFDQNDYKKLLDGSRSRIKKSQNPLVKKTRENLHDLILIITHSCCRVDEIYSLKRGNVEVVKDKKDRDLDHLILQIKGKTGEREAVALKGAVRAIERLDKRNKYKKKDLLFPQNMRRAFNSLLNDVKLKKDKNGRDRNLKSLRSTGLMLRILNNPQINLAGLARSAGTSPQILDKFYLRPLTARMMKDDLISTGYTQRKKRTETFNPLDDIDN
jgi:hypothetical protein